MSPPRRVGGELPREKVWDALYLTKGVQDKTLLVLTVKVSFSIALQEMIKNTAKSV